MMQRPQRLMLYDRGSERLVLSIDLTPEQTEILRKQCDFAETDDGFGDYDLDVDVQMGPQ